MSFLLKKVIKPWNSPKGASHLSVQETPMCPPSPDLSHLTPDEISVINDVLRRQEEFDRQEADRVRKLKDELDSLQQHLSSSARNQNKKLVDLRLCRLCFKTKFADGVGRVCHDCQQRVCPQCGAFSKPRWNTKKNKSVRGRWRCKLCIARREVLCRTGGWYHGNADVTEGLKKKLSLSHDPEAETDAGSSPCQGIVDDSEHGPSGNRTDSELVRRMAGGYPTTQKAHSLKKYIRRRSFPHNLGGGKDDRVNEQAKDDHYDEDEDDKDSLDSLILERQMSRRKRQEKRQRRRMRAGQEERSAESLVESHKSANREEPSSTAGEENGRGFIGSGSGQRRDSVTRSLWGHSNSLNSCVRKSSPISEDKGDSSDDSTSLSSAFSSSQASSVSDRGPSPMSMNVLRQDAVSLNSSCISILSTNDSRHMDGRWSHLGSSDPPSGRSQESVRVQSPTSQSGKSHSSRSQDGVSPKLLGERSIQTWRQEGFLDVYLVSLFPQCKVGDHPYGIKVTGGIQDKLRVSRALVMWLASDIRDKINVGDEILDWNGEILRGQSFDHVTSVTSRSYTQVVLTVNPSNGREDGRALSDEPIVISPERPPSHSPDLHGKGVKRRMLPRTPVEIKRGMRSVKGEIQIKLIYHPGKSALAVTVMRARNLAQTNHVENISPSPFVVISLVPGKSRRDSVETELRASSNNPEWEQTFLLDGITLTEVVGRALQITVWSYEDRGDAFLGEVLLDLTQAHLDNQAHWYSLEEHDENSAPMPHHRHSHSASLSASLTSGSFKDSNYSPAVSPEVPLHRHHRHSPSSVGSASVSPVPSGASQVGSREFHLNSVSQPDSFTTKVRKKMKNTVSKMSSLSLIEKKENAGSDESYHSDVHTTKLSEKSATKSPITMKRRQSSHPSMDLLAPPQPPSRTNSSSSFFMSDDEESMGRYSVSPSPADRPPPEGDDITSILGPGQIPPKPAAETTVCGDIKLGFMVSKGQLEVDIICAAGLHKSGDTQPPDTYVKTYLVEGKKVIQRKKTLVVKSSFDPVYRKKIKYSACNVHGRIMKIDIWERTGSFEKSCRGEVLVRLDGLDLSKHTMAWYKLFQINSTDYGSDEFLNSW